MPIYLPVKNSLSIKDLTLNKRIRLESNVNTNTLFVLEGIEKLGKSFCYLTYITLHILFTQFLFWYVTAAVDAKLRQNHNLY